VARFSDVACFFRSKYKPITKQATATTATTEATIAMVLLLVFV
jgi:hypothetical protein